MIRCFRPSFLVTACVLGPVAVQAAPAVDYSRDIQPLFAEHCLACHGPDASKGGLVLSTLAGATKELKSGAKAVVPGDPGHSALLARVTSDDAEERMPPKEKKPLKPHEIELLKAWIESGAKYDLHWAYKPVVRPTPPRETAETGIAVSSPTKQGALASAAIHPIDRFVRAKLAEKGIRPSGGADRYTLIKRVHYDLLGLPPSLEDLDGFVNDSSPMAYEAMLDRALASEHHGERWGRHWLDAARYADSDGYEKDRPRPDAWRYRDWVIRAVNDDMPFDQFSIEQIAGDLLPDATPEQIVATAFHRQTLTNTEGGTDQEQFRIEAVMDRTETTGAVWLGLTVGCARCHTHKYDQISHKEYYQIFAFYNNGDEVTRQVPTSPEVWAAYEKANGDAAKKLVPLQRQVDAAKAELPVKLPEWERGVQARLAALRRDPKAVTFAPVSLVTVTAASKARLTRQKDGSFLASGVEAKTDTYTAEISAVGKLITALRIETIPDDSLPSKGAGRFKNGNFVLSSLKLLVGKSRVTATEVPLHSATADFEQKTFAAKNVLDEDAQTGWGVGGSAMKAHSLTVQLTQPVSLEAGSKLFVILDQQYNKQPGHVLGRFRILASTDVTEDSIAPPEVIKLLGEEPKRRNPVLIKPLFDWLEKVDTEVVAASRALESAKARLPKPPLMDARVIAQRTTRPRPTHVLYRGDFLQPAESVVPATLAVLPGVKSGAPSVSELAANDRVAPPSRLDFARSLVSKDNPLTPRVTVNTIWGKLFGEGLVKTAADFGVRGSKPTHPELLDWLASEFMQQGWSRKKLLRLIMTSAAYKQSSAQSGAVGTAEHARSNAELARILEIDPKNDLLWRQNRLRVEGEIVRDLHLAASGLLSPKVGGPSVFPPMPPDIAALSYAGNFSWKTSAGEDRYRRGLYTFFKRTAPHPDLTTFDCPDANTANVKRTVSNTPLQALTTLNAEAFTEAAQALGRRVLAAAPSTDDDRLSLAMRICLSRAASEHELAALKKLLGESRAFFRAHPAEAKEASGSHTQEGVPLAESAAWAATMRIVLNTDEFITRE